jgi:hypothetical protein
MKALIASIFGTSTSKLLVPTLCIGSQHNASEVMIAHIVFCKHSSRAVQLNR